MKKPDHPPSAFWKTRPGIALQIVLVLIPSALVLQAGNLLLAGVIVSALVCWRCLKLQGKSWADLGFHRPSSLPRTLLTALASTLGLLVLTIPLRRYVTTLLNQPPNLEAFKALEGNLIALFVGLCIVWTVAAFGEEFLFRGFLLNSFHRLFPAGFPSDKTKWAISLFVTSILVGIGHAYQGLTGMILTAVIGFGFGLVYLANKRNLWSSILTHGFYDTIAFLLLFAGIRMDDWL
ncbi:MAG: CPBP family intramembrane metalloprotease [Planctomycetaceae bacterium]|nr:CPBP family intramembrane metalloprotease [Planctomycetaceae bacterium]